MRYKLQFYIGYDEEHWNLETFSADRVRFFQKVLSKMKLHNGVIMDARIEFPNGSRPLARMLADIAESEHLQYDIAVGPTYSADEIREARFVPFLQAGEEVDCDREWHELNKYARVLCNECGTPDDGAMPRLYRLDSQKMRKRPRMFSGSNGIIILSSSAFEALESDIGPWVSSGPAAVVEGGRIVRDKKEYVWIRPKCEVGWYVDAKVIQQCHICGRPTEIRKVRSEDMFEMNKEIVTSFMGVSAPIVLAGNWFGEIRSGVHFSRCRDVLISGWLHEKIKRMKLKGFVEADYIVHAADEPGHEPPE